MREVTIGDYMFPVEGSAWALKVYADSFGADLLQDAVREYIGKPVIIENLEGGSGSIGWTALSQAAPDGDADLEGLPFADFRIPPCPFCQVGVLKPDVVFFGESVPRERVEQAMAALQQVDGVLVAGSSLMVYSGYRFVDAAAKAGLPVVAINQGRTRADALLQFKQQADVGRSLEALAQGLGADRTA